MADYDVSRLDELGNRRPELRAELKRIGAELEAEIPKAADAGVIQAEIARRTGMTRESIAQLCKPRDERWRRGKA
jgi:hypothetical protein